MRILHTSDWHIGRTFHGHSTVGALETVLSRLAETVRAESIDVVIVAGDLFDSAMPSGDHFRVLTASFAALRDAGATVIATSGNHDSAARLGFQARFASLAGIHVITSPEQHLQPVTVHGADGPVHFYGIPYLEPSLVRHLFPGEKVRRHEDVLSLAMEGIREDAARRGGRYVVISHSFVVGISGVGGDAGKAGNAGNAGSAGNPEASDVERDITAGGLDFVSLEVFDGPDYVALGHIHGRSTLSERVRYSGAPVHYSFSEAGKPRGVWIAEIGEHGLESVRWADLPVPRRLSVLTGTLAELLEDEAYADAESDWVSAVLVDDVRPLDAMARLRERFEWCATLEHRPVTVAPESKDSYSARIAHKSDIDIVDGFVEYVRNGHALSPQERDLVIDAITAVSAQEAVS